MNVTCASCQTIFRVDPAKVPTRGVRARCSVCSGVFWVRHPAPSAATEAVIDVPATPPAATRPEPPPARRQAPRPPEPEHRVPPAAAEAPSRRAPEPPRPTMPPGPVVAPVASRTPGAPPASRPGGRPAGPAVPPRPAVSAPLGGAGISGPASPPSRPPLDIPAAPRRPAEPVRSGPPRAAPPPAQSVVPPPTRPAPGAPAPAAAATPAKKRRVNPFLSQDPDAKARRLARALISDMVVYHPAKRREGLQHGTLKRLFDEEVKKSWEEYVDQVGQQLAESTPYFHDALNEILADGRTVFP